jgi:uncharacterized protein YjbI with pentapeptide repeats
LKPISGPQAPRPPANDEMGDQIAEWEDLELYRDLHWKGGQLGQAAGITLERVHLVRVEIDQVQLRRLELVDVRFEHCNLSNGDWPQASVTRLLFDACRMTGFKLTRSRVEHAVFRGCQGRYTVFDASSFRFTRFENCMLADANFNGADLSKVVFERCDLTNASFKNARLAGTDFRTSPIESSQIALQELQGAILSPAQALALLEFRTGVVIRSEDA